jgi:hypothetical protein
MKTLEIKSSISQIKIKEETQSRGLKLVEEWISWPEDKAYIIGKTDKYIKKRIKKYERSMQEFQEPLPFINKPILWIIALKKKKRCKPKTYEEYSIKQGKNFPKHEKVTPIKVQEASRIPNKAEWNGSSLWNKENKERILKASRKKWQITCKGKPIRITADFLTADFSIRKNSKEWVISKIERQHFEA